MENQQSLVKDRKTALFNMIEALDLSKVTKEHRLDAHKKAMKAGQFCSIEYDMIFYTELLNNQI